MKFGELIAIGRECKGWTLRDMERETGISNALISQIEHGHIKDCGFRTAVRLIDALGISMERAAKTVRPFNPQDILRATIVGKVSGHTREADQVRGMAHAICHACGLGYKCMDADCPNEKTDPTWPTNAVHATGG
jgi:transcriptional regulator with XRE-family HTH domain